MQAAGPKRHFRIKKLYAAVALTLLVATGFAFFAGQVAQYNADQAQIFALTIQNATFQARLAPNGTCQGVHCTAYQTQTGEFTEYLYFAPTSVSRLFADQVTFSNGTSLVSKGFIPDCQSWCFSGIHFFIDPTYIIPNQGRDFQSCQLFGKSNTITCVKHLTTGGSANATAIYTSTSSTVPAAADTYASGPCQSSNIYTTSESGYGLGTVTAGTPGATTTDTVAVTITFSGTTSSLPTICLLTALTGGTNPYVYGEGQIGPFTFNNGDSLTATFSDALS